MSLHRPSLFRRVAKACMGFGMAVLFLGSVVVPTLPAMAQSVTPEEAAVTIPPAPSIFNVNIVGNAYEEVKKKFSGFFTTLTIGGVTSLMNAFQVFSQRIAYDAAQRILTGDAGQYPLFWEDTFPEYLGKVAQDAGDQFVSSLNDEVLGKQFGLDLCTPFDPFKLSLSLGANFKTPEFLEAKCTPAKIAAAYDEVYGSLDSDEALNKYLAASFNPDANQLNIGIEAHNNYIEAQAKAEANAILDRQETEGLKNIQDVISGKIKTPAQVIKDTVTEGNVLKYYNETGRMNYLALAGNAFSIGFTQLGVITAATFVNTLAGGLLDKIFKGFKDVDLADVDLTSAEEAGNRNVATARILFSDLLTPNLISTEQQDFVTELAGCPTPRGMWNCSMDDAFATALRTVGETGAYTVGQASLVSLNGQPPSNPAFLHKEWELIPETDVKENSDPTCYQRAYCASNLVKLRYARILPAGWELAANSPYNQKRNGKYVTLEEAVRGFNVCNDEGKADSSHPWCKLVDPNWVLSAPPFQCRVKGSGDSILPGSSIRLEECADAISCLGRDDQGKCTQGYGYCVAEKPVWRFPADACLERFASCRTYATRSNQRVSFLRNTIDYGSCSAESIGCMWYATQRVPVASTQEVWAGSASTGSRIYLDATAKTCPAGADGCTRVLEVKIGSPSLNLIENGSFEETRKNDDMALKGWVRTDGGSVPASQRLTENAVAGSFSWANSLLASTIQNETVIDIQPLRNYTLTLSVRGGDEFVFGNYSASLNLQKANGTPVASANVFRGTGCTANTASSVGISKQFTEGQVGHEWVRYECSFVSNPDAARAVLVLQGNNYVVDAIQLEEGEFATGFTDGVADGLEENFMRVAPTELGCQGLSTDNPACSKYARMCAPTDQGCQGYRDIANSGAPEIPASLSAGDFCPNSCVGYAEYRKQPSAFDLGKNADSRLDDPQDDTVAAFIPTNAQQCSLADVGCEEFTNIETGGESENKSYFNYVRACEKPSANSETYFTWEGSDTTGYQLRTWSLVHDTASTPNAPKLLQKTGPDGLLKEPAACNVQAWQAGLDPDCRQFFNAQGAVFYAYFSQTVLSSADCRDYRKNGSSAADCEKTGGAYTPASGECIYKILDTESRSCNSVNASCRAYIGTTGRNTSVVFDEQFRSGTTTSAFTLGDLSNESILVGDQSLKVTGGGQSLQTATVFNTAPNQLYTISFWAKTTNSQLRTASVLVDGVTVGTFPMQVDWRRYEFGPFGAESIPTSTLSFAGLPNTTYLDQIRIERLQDVSFVVKNSWTIPQECEQTPEGLPQPQAMLGCRAYRDRDNATVNVRRFGQLCREEAIGCKAFVDTRNSDSPYSETFVISGTDVNNKVTPEARAYESLFVGTVTTTRPADRYVYLIDEPGAHCDAQYMSCRAFGKPQYTQDLKSLQTPSTTAFETVYLIDDITAYVDGGGEPNMLCRKNELFCEEFKSGKTVAYFRNPDKHTCEWKDKVLLGENQANGIPADGEYSGWFQTGTDTPCYPGFLSQGNTFLQQNSGDPSYVGWAGNCPVEQSECTEFRDPNDQTDPIHPTGKPYYFIKNSHLDLTSCGGQVDLLNGCVLFRDISDPRNRYSSKATYAKSASEDDTPQAPVDCVTDPDNQFCQNAGTCVVSLQSWCEDRGDNYLCTRGAGSTQYWKDDVQSRLESTSGISCSQDSDCDGGIGNAIRGICEKNDANVVVKVKLDRDCAQWLGCSSAETVYDPAQGKYVDVCTDVAMCDVSKGASAGSFCAHYVDREEDPILNPGVFFDSAVYSSRVTGFGEIDYSGYAIPDRFQAADIQNRRVGWELFQQTPAIRNKFALDYRLVAAVRESTGLVQFDVEDNLYPDLELCRHIPTNRVGYTFGSNVVGQRTCYFAVDALTARTAGDAGTQGVDPRNIQALSDVLRQSVDPRNDIALLSSLPPAECKAYPESNAPFPNYYVKEWNFSVEPFKAETLADGYTDVNVCEYGEDCSCSYRKVSYGETTKYISPFGKAPVGGLCVGGSKDGESCVPGEIQGNGETGEVAPNTSGEDPGCPGGGRCMDIDSVVLVRGQFGQCLQRDYSRTVAGDPGRHPCLIWNPNPILSGTYDSAHYIPTAGYMPPVNSGEYYCLSYADRPIDSVWSAESHTWWKDSHSLIPAGYEGELGGNQFFYLPGQLSKFNYDRGYIAGLCPDTADMCGDLLEGDCNCWDGTDADGDDDFPGSNRDLAEAVDQYPAVLETWLGGAAALSEDILKNPLQGNNSHAFFDYVQLQNLGSNLEGNSPQGSGDQAEWCAMIAAWKDTEDLESGDAPAPGIGPKEQAPDVDLNLGRWVQTGQGISRTYAEYFIPVKPGGVYQWLNDGLTADNLDGTDRLKALNAAVLERNFGEFRFFTSNDPYSAACRIPKYYVDGVDVANFSDPNEVFSASKQIYSAFNSEFDGALNRSKELIVTDDELHPTKEVCSGLNDGLGEQTDYAGDDGRCYMKAWEMNYRMDGVDNFDWLDTDPGTSLWGRHDRAYFHERTCSKSGFAIRAVFENASKYQNNIPEEEIAPEDLSGPWHFVGFWVSACTAGTDDAAFLYLGLRVKHADICQELAQTVAPYSRETAAFADRAWSRGTFSVPLLGYTYASTYSPFGSALVNGIPGSEPLFQTGGPAENYSILKPPVFLGSGQTYVTLRPTPVQHWAHLSNVFARIYRIYEYNDQAVVRDGFACFRGPNYEFTGIACPNRPPDGSSSLVEWQNDTDQLCSGRGVCNPDLVSIAVKANVHRCNGLSGVNAGFECGGSFSLATNDPVCHNAAMKNVGNNTYVPQYTSCQARGGWTQEGCGSEGMWRNPNVNGGNCLNTKTAHEQNNAFGCGPSAVRPSAGCAIPSTISQDCPLQISAGSIECKSDPFGPMVGHCAGGYEHARCDTSADCVFTTSQWWGAYDDGKPDTLGANYNDVDADSFVMANNLASDEDASIYQIGSGYLGGMMVRAYPKDGTAPVPENVDGVNQGEGVPLPFGNYGGDENTANTSQSTIKRNRYGEDCGDLGDGVCRINESGSRWINHTLVAPFAAYVRWGSMARLADSNPLLKRWPQPHNIVAPLNEVGAPILDAKMVIPGLCEGADGAKQDPNGALVSVGISPTFFNTINQEYSKFIDARFGTSTFYGMAGYADRNWALQVGRCDGGDNNGAFCFNTQPGGLCSQGSSETFACWPVTEKIENGQYTPIEQCTFEDTTFGDSTSRDPNLDNNSCTRPSGYTPLVGVCGDNADNEKCLTYYDLSATDDARQKTLDQTRSLAPTDVTGGFHVPTYLGLNGDPDTERHIAFYAPRPPTIAAPDLKHTCQAPGSCPISSVGSFTVEDQSSGPVSFAGGQAQVNIRFYGWADHDQTPLQSVYVDWGDGTIVKIDDARMKNKKPFCGVTKECSLTPGLTCNADSDCPPGGGKCAERGTCSQTPNVACFLDSDCSVTGKPGDKCQVREFFGNSTDACEANYFDFTHAYTCDKDVMPDCNESANSNGSNSDYRCLRHPDIVCNTLSPNSATCGGDPCVAGLAKPTVEGVGGGCFDEQKNTCIYTPRVMLKDSFNWCTGDCRAGARVGNSQIDTNTSKVKHTYGGCWDGTETVRNTDLSRQIMTQNENECRLDATNPSIRPWIVYPGAVVIGTVQ